MAAPLGFVGALLIAAKVARDVSRKRKQDEIMEEVGYVIVAHLLFRELGGVSVASCGFCSIEKAWQCHWNKHCKCGMA